MRRIDDPIVVEDSKTDGRYRSLSFRTFVASVLGLLCVYIRNLSFALFRLNMSKVRFLFKTIRSVAFHNEFTLHLDRIMLRIRQLQDCWFNDVLSSRSVTVTPTTFACPVFDTGGTDPFELGHRLGFDKGLRARSEWPFSSCDCDGALRC